MKFMPLVCSSLIAFNLNAFAQTRPELSFDFTNTTGLWQQLGQDIDGEAIDDRSGESVSLSVDGLTVAIGAPDNDGNGVFVGHTRIYRLNEVTNQWEQFGQDIDGDATFDDSGESVSVSADGLTVAIGAPGNDTNGPNSGHVRIYRFNEVTNQWEQFGQDIDGEDFSDGSGRSVSLSADGLTVAIGAPDNDANGVFVGHTRIYRFNEVTNQWEQFGQDIDGDATFDDSGESVSVSVDGLTVAIGAPGNDTNGSNSGHVRMART